MTSPNGKEPNFSNWLDNDFTYMLSNLFHYKSVGKMSNWNMVQEITWSKKSFCYSAVKISEIKASIVYLWSMQNTIIFKYENAGKILLREFSRTWKQD